MGTAPRPPVCATFELHWLSQNVSKVTYLHFSTILVEVESSKTHLEVLGLGFGLEASSPRKLACPRFRGQHYFLHCYNFVKRLKIFFGKRFIVEIARKIFVKTFFFLESTCACVLDTWPWPQAFLSLAPDFFCVLGLRLALEPCVLDSTSVY